MGSGSIACWWDLADRCWVHTRAQVVLATRRVIAGPAVHAHGGSIVDDQLPHGICKPCSLINWWRCWYNRVERYGGPSGASVGHDVAVPTLRRTGRKAPSRICKLWLTFVTSRSDLNTLSRGPRQTAAQRWYSDDVQLGAIAGAGTERAARGSGCADPRTGWSTGVARLVGARGKGQRCPVNA